MLSLFGFLYYYGNEIGIFLYMFRYWIKVPNRNQQTKRGHADAFHLPEGAYVGGNPADFWLSIFVQDLHLLQNNFLLALDPVVRSEPVKHGSKFLSYTLKTYFLPVLVYCIVLYCIVLDN